MSVAYAIEPIRGQPASDGTTRLREEAWAQAGYAPLPAIPPPVIGWRLVLSIGDNAIEQRECGEGEEGFMQAQRDGAAWLQRHGEDGISQWMAQAAQASRRMAWDHGYRHALSRRGV